MQNVPNCDSEGHSYFTIYIVDSTYLLIYLLTHSTVQSPS